MLCFLSACTIKDDQTTLGIDADKPKLVHIQKLTVGYMSGLQTLQNSGAYVNTEICKVQVEISNIPRARNWIYLFIVRCISFEVD